VFIFLDIDGVLKPDQNSFSCRPHNVFDQNCLDNFENAIRQFDNIKIVISSTWKLVYTLKKIQQLFSDDIQPLVVGMTPDAYGQTTDYERYKEVLAYLKKNNDEDCDWVAIDDDPEHYPKKCTVILTESSTGFNHTSALELERLISEKKHIGIYCH